MAQTIREEQINLAAKFLVAALTILQAVLMFGLVKLDSTLIKLDAGLDEQSDAVQELVIQQTSFVGKLDLLTEKLDNVGRDRWTETEAKARWEVQESRDAEQDRALQRIERSVR